MKVEINGVLYAPAKETIVNREMLLRALIETFWGDVSKWTVERLEEAASELRVGVRDDHRGVPVHDFLDRLAEVRSDET